MSVVHINQIRTHLHKEFDDFVEMTEVNFLTEDWERKFLSRALAAYSISSIGQFSAQEVASSITDGGNDNGLDAIHIDESDKRVYLVQSKWINDGRGQPSSGDIKKFLDGIRDLFNSRFERFNEVIRSRQNEIVRAINDPTYKYYAIVVHTGSSALGVHAARDLESFVQEINDPSELIELIVFDQRELHSSLTQRVTGQPIDIDVSLRSWGRVEEPIKAVYGQVSAKEITEWWRNHRERLFARNLRGVLGNTDVNSSIASTIETYPERLWYYNNGITVIAKKITKTAAGSGQNNHATFHCEDLSVVNGAQTVGTIGKTERTLLDNLEIAFVQIRLISLEDTEEGFGHEITRTNNFQNRIDNRDFVALDPEQTRIKTELAIDEVSYVVMRSDAYERGSNSFDLNEATVALVSASAEISLAVQLKREIGKLWENTDRPPYKALFNRSVTGPYLWRCVQAQRLTDSNLTIEANLALALNPRHHAIGIHGNRMISLLVFRDLSPSSFEQTFDLSLVSNLVANSVSKYYRRLITIVERDFENAIVPTLFKNASKCREIHTKCLDDLEHQAAEEQQTLNLD